MTTLKKRAGDADTFAGRSELLAIALDVARFITPDVFRAEVDRHIRDLASSQRLPGVDDIRVPGQGRVARRKEREQNGVPLNATLVAQVDEVAKSLGIVPLSTRRE